MEQGQYRCLDVRRAGGVLHVRLDNPPVNLLDAKLTRELNSLAKSLADDEGIKVVVVSSADPDFFICHSDDTELLALPKPEAGAPAELGPFHRIMERFRGLPQITVGKIDGIARGGGLEFLLTLDLRFASGRSRFALPEVAVGLIPGGGGTQRLPRLIGYSRALYMMASGEDVDAATAEQWGLLNRVVDEDKLDGWVDAFAQRMAAFPGSALRAVKQAAAAESMPLSLGLLEEERLFRSLLQNDGTRARAEAFYRLGSQDRQKQVAEFEQMIRSLPPE